MLARDPRLSEPTARRISEEAEHVYVSAATLWELAIKRSLGKLTIEDDLRATVDASGFEELPIRFEHAEHVVALPHHHRDPFDRMLIAQAQSEDLTIVSADREIAKYGISTLEP